MRDDPLEAFLADKHGGQISPKLRAFLDEQDVSVLRKAWQEAEWVRNLDYLCRVLSEGDATPSDCQLFWVRLWGVIGELHARYADVDDSVSGRLFSGRQAVRGKLKVLRERLSEKELALLRYMRTCQCHVHQDYLLGTPRNKFKKGRFNETWEPFDAREREFIIDFHKRTGMEV